MKLRAFLLILTVTLAGCVGQPSSFTSTNGVIIKSFTANPPEVESRTRDVPTGTPVVLSTVIQNAGESDAEWVTVKIIGLSSDWLFKPGNIIRGRCAAALDAFSPMSGVSEVDECRYYGIGRMFPADPSRNLPEGQESVAEWELMSPFKKEVEQTYEVGARLSYHYKTVFDSVMRIVNSRYYQQTGNKGGIVTSKTSGGPLVVDIKVPSFIITEAEGGKNVPIQIEIQNVGSGRAFLWKEEDRSFGYIIREPSVDDWDIVEVNVKLDNNDISKECKLTDGKYVKLISGKSGRISCKIPISDSVETFIDKAIDFDFTYNYVVDSATAIRVIPISE